MNSSIKKLNLHMKISLMQKYTREKRTQNNGRISEDFIQFRLFRVRDTADVVKSVKTGQKFQGEQLERVGNSGDYINKREVVARFRLKPGFYVVVPSLFQANVAGHFMLRTFTEQLVGQKDSSGLNENSILNRAEVKPETAKFKTADMLSQSVNLFRPRLENDMTNERRIESHSLTAGLMGESLEEHLDNLRKKEADGVVVEKKRSDGGEKAAVKKGQSFVEEGIGKIIKAEMVTLIDEHLDNIRKREVVHEERISRLNKKQMCLLM